jgi:hypothetical protein
LKVIQSGDRPDPHDLGRRVARTLRELLPDFQIGVERGAPERAWDATLTIQSGRSTRRVLVEYKSVGEPRYLAQAITVLTLGARQSPRSYSLVAAPYIGPEGRRLCREAGVGYIDWSGNAFLRFDGVLVDRQALNGHGGRRRGCDVSSLRNRPGSSGSC